MATLPETLAWSTVYQIEVTDPVQGGADGVSNLQAKQLVSRTAYLKAQVESVGGNFAAHEAAVDPHPQYLTSAEGDAKVAAHAALANPHPQYATPASIQQVAYSVASASGTADALTASFTPAIATLSAGLTLHVRAALANTATAPTFAPNGLTAKTIVKGANQALAVGDIAGAGHWLTLQYDATLDKWVLQNPYANPSQSMSTGSGMPAGTIIFVAGSSAPADYLKANGADVSRTTYANLYAAIGTTFGVGNGSTTFTLPDLRGEFLRGWDDGRGVDTGRAFGSAQEATAIRVLIDNLYNEPTGTFAIGMRNVDGYFFPPLSGYPFNGTNAISDFRYQATSSLVATGNANIASFVRPRNVALLACIKY